MRPIAASVLFSYWLLTVAGLTLRWDAALTPWCRSYLFGDATCGGYAVSDRPDLGQPREVRPQASDNILAGSRFFASICRRAASFIVRLGLALGVSRRWRYSSRFWARWR